MRRRVCHVSSARGLFLATLVIGVLVIGVLVKFIMNTYVCTKKTTTSNALLTKIKATLPTISRYFSH